MNHQFSILSVIILIALGITSCSDLSDRQNARSLVGVYGIISPLTKHQEVRLVRAFNMDASWNDIIDSLYTVESGASVTITLNDNIEARLTEIRVASGIYRDTAGVLPYRKNGLYRLNVRTSANEVIQAETRVPDTSALLAPVNLDTLKIALLVDTGKKTYCYQGSPVQWEWSTANGAGAYYAWIGGDSITTFSTIHGYQHRPRVVLLASKHPQTKTRFTIFENDNPFEGEQWLWHESISNKNEIQEYPLFFRIHNYSFKITDDRRAVILSNVKNGFGYFSALSISRKALYVIVQTTIVN